MHSVTRAQWKCTPLCTNTPMQYCASGCTTIEPISQVPQSRWNMKRKCCLTKKSSLAGIVCQEDTLEKEFTGLCGCSWWADSLDGHGQTWKDLTFLVNFTVRCTTSPWSPHQAGNGRCFCKQHPEIYDVIVIIGKTWGCNSNYETTLRLQ